MDWWDSILLLLVIFGALIFASAVYALYWAAKNGQFDDFERGAKTIFTEEEPEGEILDAFPGQKKKHAKKESKQQQGKKEWIDEPEL